MRRFSSRIGILDVGIGLLLLAGGLYMAYRIRIGLHYRWDWEAIPQFLLRYDPQQERWVPNLLIQGLFTTIRLSLWATVLAGIFGTVMGLFRVSPSLFKRLLGRTYVEVTRNLPPLVLVFLFYFFIGDQILPALGIDGWVRSASAQTQHLLALLMAPPELLTAFLSALITLALFEGAYITEIVRAGIESIEKGQWESASAMGFTRFQAMRHVILPQATRRIMPPLAGQFISTIKDSAIVSAISIQELTFQGMELMAATRLTFEIWITISLLYLLLTLSCSLAVERIDMTLNRSRVAP